MIFSDLVVKNKIREIERIILDSDVFKIIEDVVRIEDYQNWKFVDLDAFDYSYKKITNDITLYYFDNSIDIKINNTFISLNFDRETNTIWYENLLKEIRIEKYRIIFSDNSIEYFSIYEDDNIYRKIIYKDGKAFLMSKNDVIGEVSKLDLNENYIIPALDETITYLNNYLI